MDLAAFAIVPVRSCLMSSRFSRAGAPAKSELAVPLMSRGMTSRAAPMTIVTSSSVSQRVTGATWIIAAFRALVRHPIRVVAALSSEVAQVNQTPRCPLPDTAICGTRMTSADIRRAGTRRASAARAVTRRSGALEH